MNLVYSVALLGLAAILFVVFLLGDRLPDRAGWMSEGVISDLSSVAIAGLIAFGACFGVRFFVFMGERPFGLKEVALLTMTLVVYYLIFRHLAPRRRLREYAAELARRSASNKPSETNVVTITSPESNHGSSNEPTLPRAA